MVMMRRLFADTYMCVPVRSARSGLSAECADSCAMYRGLLRTGLQCRIRDNVAECERFCWRMAGCAGGVVLRWAVM